MEGWYDIVELDEEKASQELRAMWQKLHPGSVVVKVGNMLFYEGGLYTRPATRNPEPGERIDYACHAADRGATRYPTVAVWGPQVFLTGLKVIGTVNPKLWQAKFY
jgi:hypothetical protein